MSTHRSLPVMQETHGRCWQVVSGSESQLVQSRCHRSGCQHVQHFRRAVSSTCFRELLGILIVLLPVWRGVFNGGRACPGLLNGSRRMPVTLRVSSSSILLECNSVWLKHFWAARCSTGSGGQEELALNGQLLCTTHSLYLMASSVQSSLLVLHSLCSNVENKVSYPSTKWLSLLINTY